MKYKVGDRVRIKDDISKCNYRNAEGLMDNWQGKAMTIRAVEGRCYKMKEDRYSSLARNPSAGWNWYEDMIAGLAEPEMTNAEVFRLAIDTYGAKKQVAVCIMMQQAKMMFGEKEVDRFICQKIKRLAQDLEDEREVEIVHGKHGAYGKFYTWINPDKHEIRVGGIVKADTRNGEKPIIVANTNTAKYKHGKHHRKITGGVE